MPTLARPPWARRNLHNTPSDPTFSKFSALVHLLQKVTIGAKELKGAKHDAGGPLRSLLGPRPSAWTLLGPATVDGLDGGGWNAIQHHTVHAPPFERDGHSAGVGNLVGLCQMLGSMGQEGLKERAEKERVAADNHSHFPALGERGIEAPSGEAEEANLCVCVLDVCECVLDVCECVLLGASSEAEEANQDTFEHLLLHVI